MRVFYGFAARIALSMLLYDITIDANYGTVIFHLILSVIDGLFAVFGDE